MEGFWIFLKVFLVASVLVKGYVFIYVAERNEVKLSYGGGFPIEALWYLNNPVAEEYQSHKKFCNLLQSVNLILLAFLILAGFLF